MRKPILILLIISIVFCLVSCGKETMNNDIIENETQSTSENSFASETLNETSTTTETTTETTTSTTEAKTTTTTTTKKDSVSTAMQSDFEKLEKLLNSDGGIILHKDFNSKTASKYDFIRFAASSGFFPAYQTYINDNMWSDNIIKHEDYSEMTIPADAFNWILKNIYNYKGNEIKETVHDDNFSYIDYKNGKFYISLPLDEAGLYGEFHYKSYEKKDNQYIIQFDFDGFEPYSDIEKTFTWKYTVKAELKEVDNVDGTKRIKVWSVNSIERNN